jgi:glutamyl-tRNA reductase
MRTREEILRVAEGEVFNHMGIVTVGLSHKAAPVTTRERIAFSQDQVVPALEQFAKLSAINEGLIISTCNRVELVAHVEQEEVGISTIKEFLYHYHALKPGELDVFFYEFQGVAAVRHMFRVACGLDSMVIGESQILGQLRDAYGAAQSVGCIGSNLTQLMIRTLQVAKRVRNETKISEAGWSVSRAAVELAKRTLGDLTDRTILVVGAGKMSKLTTSHLRRSGVKKVLVTNRTYERAARLAAEFQGEAVDFDDLDHALVRSDIVIASTAIRTDYVIGRSDVERVLSERRGRSILFIDIAVPRNVEPTITALPDVYLCDIDGLQDIVALHARENTRIVDIAEQMVDQEVGAFSSTSDNCHLGPIITSLKEKIQSIGSAELERHICKSTTASLQDRHRLEMMVARITNKILHPLIVYVKQQTRLSPGDTQYIKGLAAAFDGSRDDGLATGS